MSGNMDLWHVESCSTCASYRSTTQQFWTTKFVRGRISLPNEQYSEVETSIAPIMNPFVQTILRRQREHRLYEDGVAKSILGR
jgi:heterodisulfide reductase subunit B